MIAATITRTIEQTHVSSAWAELWDDLMEDYKTELSSSRPCPDYLAALELDLGRMGRMDTTGSYYAANGKTYSVRA